MSDSNAPERPRGAGDRERRFEAVRRWVEYIETHDPEVWGEQLNRLVDSQLASAQRSAVSAEQRRRVARAAERRRPPPE